MGRVAIALLISLAMGAMSSAGYIGAGSLYAKEELYIGASLDSEKDKAIGIAKEVCDRERLNWEDVAIMNRGGGRWRITITSYEQGKTLVVEVDARDGTILSKSFK